MPLKLGPGLSSLAETRMNRRHALATIGKTGLAILAGCSHRAGSRGNTAGWYALLSDPHIAADPCASLRGEVMSDNLRAVVADILAADDPPRGVLVDGDLAFHHGDSSDYATFLRCAEPLLRHDLPVHVTLGNHDHRENLRKALADRFHEANFVADKVVGSVAGSGVRFVLLDSQNGVNVTAGLLGEAQLTWLARDLDAHPIEPAVILVHHNINSHSESALRDTEALLEVLRPRRQAKAVVFGHTHVWNVRKIEDIHMINLPAIGYRFLPKQPLGWVVFRPRKDGAELELRCVGGDRKRDQKRVDLKWRAA